MSDKKPESLFITHHVIMQFDKHYTLEEANALLPWVRRIFERVHQVAAQLPPEFHLNPKAEQAIHEHSSSTLLSDHARALKSGLQAWMHDVAEIPRQIALEESLRKLTNEQKLELIGGLLQGVIEHGIIIQDVGRGLIDFPALAGGDEVLLCYQLADGDRILAWHDLHAGFAGRQAIEHLPQ